MKAKVNLARALAIGLAVGGLSACGGFSETDPDDLPYDPDLPVLPGEREVEPYTGDNPIVLAAQDELPTGYDLHRKVIQRSCTPNEGVCHNRKEYPDMRTSESFLAMVGAPCNAAPKLWSTVYDRCERTGDELYFDDPAIEPVEIGYMEHIPGEHVDYGGEGTSPDTSSPGIHIRLRDPVTFDRESFYAVGRVSRRLLESSFEVASYRSRFWVLDGGRHLYAEVPGYRSDEAAALVGAGVAMGDENRNGVFGASATPEAKLIAPGSAMDSYLVARLRGRMAAEPIPGSRMPLANEVPSVGEMLALACFIEGLAEGETPSLAWPIDYAGCSFIADPTQLSLTGDGAPTWSGGVWPLLKSNCGGCHVAPNAPEGLDLVGEGAYLEVLGQSAQGDLSRVEPGSPETSYLWLKLVGDASIVGAQMPLTDDGGSRQLPQEDLDLIRAWIEGGALND